MKSLFTRNVVEKRDTHLVNIVRLFKQEKKTECTQSLFYGSGILEKIKENEKKDGNVLVLLISIQLQTKIVNKQRFSEKLEPKYAKNE